MPHLIRREGDIIVVLMADYPIFSKQYIIDKRVEERLASFTEEDEEELDQIFGPRKTKEELEATKLKVEEEVIEETVVSLEEAGTKGELFDALLAIAEQGTYVGNNGYPNAERYLGIADGIYAFLEDQFHGDTKYLKILREEIPSKRKAN